jgi:hypothetical protein
MWRHESALRSLHGSTYPPSPCDLHEAHKLRSEVRTYGRKDKLSDAGRERRLRIRPTTSFGVSIKKVWSVLKSSS